MIEGMAGDWERDVQTFDLELDVREQVKFGLRWWTGTKSTMNWFTIGPMRVDHQEGGDLVGVMVTINGRVFGVTKSEWWT